MFQPSKYQQAIFDFVQFGKGHGVIDAVPGSGKTTTLIEAAKLLKTTNAIFLAFNKHIATEIGKKLKEQGSSMQAMTIHSLGLQALRALPVRAQIDDKKYRYLCREYLLAKQSYDYQLSQALQKLTSFAQLTLSETDEQSLWELVEHFGIDQISRNDAEWPIVWKGVSWILEKGTQQALSLGTIDFNDMVWLPTVLELSPAKVDYLFVDECQDLNQAQLELVLKSVNGTGRLLFVGDERQSLYGFAGADTQSVKNIIKRTHATVLPLSICYRCPKSHVQMCADIFPGIEAAPDMADGSIEHVKPEALHGIVKPGDLVLCRTTAPLVETCLSLLREGVRAKVRGRDIGKNFVDLVSKLQKQYLGLDIENFSEKLAEYRNQQAMLIGLSEDADMKLAALDDKINTMQALFEAYVNEHKDTSSFSGFQIYIESFFSDELGPTVILSTVHKAKGLEEARVFILKPELMPHPKAKRGWQYEQELNIKYVAYSRSKYSKDIPDSGKLFFVDYLQPEEDEEEEQPALFDPFEADIAGIVPEPAMTIVEEPIDDIQIAIDEFGIEKWQPREEEAPKPKKKSEPTKKKDFRFPIRLLEALKAAADRTGMSDTEYVVRLLEADPGIQETLAMKEEEVKA